MDYQGGYVERLLEMRSMPWAFAVRRKHEGARSALGIRSMRFIASLLLASRRTPQAPRPAVACTENHRFKTLRFPIQGLFSK